MKYLILSLIILNTNALELRGKLLPSKACKNEKMGQLFISKDKKLIYQIEMPPNGTFNLKLPKDVFEFSYVMEDGCNALVKADLNKEREQLTLKVAK